MAEAMLDYSFPLDFDLLDKSWELTAPSVGLTFCLLTSLCLSIFRLSQLNYSNPLDYSYSQANMLDISIASITIVVSIGSILQVGSFQFSIFSFLVFCDCSTTTSYAFRIQNGSHAKL